ncbi:hypothetical protein T265_01785 [Opisthorchis viverrini]|uniref:Uncharacterized protein n=1 Tax=Opisthorchis viverrini TaxID=6198 RepID=A0A075A902_OPIVI|nr:hypothetical protein T265_01785 [Opisthorchis viverrini]KER32175.1 hypothetical protein T265_01785 [Opisthorchis viverrini]
MHESARHLWRHNGLSLNPKGSAGRWLNLRGGQPFTWQRSMKEITKRLSAVGAIRLPGWGPRDPHCAWLETLQDMTANRCQWQWGPRDPHCAWLETLQDMTANRCQWRCWCQFVCRLPE